MPKKQADKPAKDTKDTQPAKPQKRGDPETSRTKTASFISSHEFLARLDKRTAQLASSRSKAIERDIIAYWTITEIGLGAARHAISRQDAEVLARILADISLDPSHLFYLAGGGLQGFIRAKLPGPDGEALAGRIAHLDRLAMIGLVDWATTADPDATGFREE